ncbi:hypothetical protein IWQ60_002217 [Tieghemiomyces parasiticus]|uniref:LIM zinc-binding domain-containing protein n=1 Tax=Tieghemiomyces parasiticus TaxID=78921 RepID=A0A9W8E180_9FUNG|nr:hypothetical protein IWQ60_002217 [Tieghemiomyces parasiticus]
MAICTRCGDLVRLNKCRCGRRPVPAIEASPDTPAEVARKGDPWSSTYLNRLFGEDAAPPRRTRPISMPPNPNARSSPSTTAASPTFSSATRDSDDLGRSPGGTASPTVPAMLASPARQRALTSVPKFGTPLLRKPPTSAPFVPVPSRPSQSHHYTHNAYRPQPTMRHFPPPTGAPTRPLIKSSATSPALRSAHLPTPVLNRASTSSPKVVTSPTTGSASTTHSPQSVPRALSAVDTDGMVHNGVSRVAMPGSLEERSQCVDCHKSLRPTERQTSPLRPGAVYCDECYSQSFSKGFCQSCKRLILTHGRPWVQYKDKVWHKMCLSCVGCRKLLLSPLVDLEGNPCCEACFTASAGNRPQSRPLSTSTATPVAMSNQFPDPSVVPPYQKRLSSSPRSPLAIVMQNHPLPVPEGKSTKRSLRRSSVDTTSLCLPSKLPPSHRLSIAESLQAQRDGQPPTILDSADSSTTDLATPPASATSRRSDSGCSEHRTSAASTPSAESTLTPPTPLSSTPSLMANPDIDGLANSLARSKLSADPSRSAVVKSAAEPIAPSTTVPTTKTVPVAIQSTSTDPTSKSGDSPHPVVSRSLSRASTATPVSSVDHIHDKCGRASGQPRPVSIARRPDDSLHSSFADAETPTAPTPFLDQSSIPQRCARCQIMIEDTWFRLSDGRQLHPACFTCAGCNQLVEDGMYVIDAGKEYHQRCVPVHPPVVSAEVVTPDPHMDHCDRCRAALDGPRFQLTNGKRYHPDCFICSGCHKLFEEGTYVCYEGQEYHRECVPKMNVLRCGKCRSLINGLFVRHNAHSYHPQCFTCTDCNQEITPQMPFGEHHGHPYCEPCLSVKVAGSVYSSPAIRPYAISAATSQRKRDPRGRSVSSSASSVANSSRGGYPQGNGAGAGSPSVSTGVKPSPPHISKVVY